MSLWSDFLSHQGRSALKWKHYFPIYERHFARYVNRPVTMIEIGCGEGGSLQLWKKYFGPNARIIGIDINPRCKSYEEDQIYVRIGNQADEAFLADVVREFGTPDIVLDDGSHIMLDMITTFRYLYQRTNVHGVYLVEDVHTAYMEKFGGGLRREGSFIEICKDLIDELGAETAGPGGAKATEFTRTTLGISFYDSVVAFERGSTTHKHFVKSGPERGIALIRSQAMDVSPADQPSIVEKLLAAHPDKDRLVFVHIPKCAGTDLSANLVKLYPAAIHHTLSHPAWTPPSALQTAVNTIEATIAQSDHILVHGHIRLRWVMNRKIARPDDRLFTVVREPSESLLSQVNYFTNRLVKDPRGERPDTKRWLSTLEVADVVGWSAPDVAAIAVRLIIKNPMCNCLGDGTAESALTLIRVSNIEISDTSRYKQWAEASWGVPFTTRFNVSRKVVEEMPQEIVASACEQDIKLYAAIMHAMGDDLMVRGGQV
jgi:23S rRNA U2552 (ribose-2'-O)-methylase RlmE/FtsJ